MTGARMKEAWKTALIMACLMSFILLLGFFNQSKPRILVLHSGAEGSPWVQQVDRGMRAALETNRRPVTVEWMYMDVAAPGAGRAAGPAQAEARRAIAREDPSVVIAVDDEANELVGRDYVGRKDPRIVYLALDRPPADYGYVGAPNVSGLAERLPFAAIREAITTLFPGRRPTASVIGVDSITGRAELAQSQAFDWGPVDITAAQLVSTGRAWRAFVSAARSDVLVVLSCQDLTDDGGKEFTAAEAAQWTQVNAEPLPIGTQVDFVANGGALGFAPPPDANGRKAIQLALDWLDERQTPGPPAPVESAHFEVAVRQGALAKRGIALPSIYIEAARENESLFG